MSAKALRVLALVVVLAGALLMLAPFYLMFVFATHTDAAILSLPPPLWFGDALGANLRTLLQKLPTLWQNLGYSVYVALAITALNLFFCALAGHAFALLDFPGREPLFNAVLATLLLPAFLSMVPTVMMMSWLGWMNEHRALIVPAACGAVGVFMMRQYIRAAVPRDLIDAAAAPVVKIFGKSVQGLSVIEPLTDADGRQSRNCWTQISAAPTPEIWLPVVGAISEAIGADIRWDIDSGETRKSATSEAWQGWSMRENYSEQ